MTELNGSLWQFPSDSISKRKNWQLLKPLILIQNPCIPTEIPVSSQCHFLKLWQMTSALLDKVGEQSQPWSTHSILQGNFSLAVYLVAPKNIHHEPENIFSKAFHLDLLKNPWFCVIMKVHVWVLSIIDKRWICQVFVLCGILKIMSILFLK